MQIKIFYIFIETRHYQNIKDIWQLLHASGFIGLNFPFPFGSKIYSLKTTVLKYESELMCF